MTPAPTDNAVHAGWPLGSTDPAASALTLSHAADAASSLRMDRADERLGPAGFSPAELVERCQQGSQEAFGELVRLYESRLYHYILQLTSHAHDAQDLTQDTFLKAWRSIRGFRAGSSLTAWLFTIARRTALNHFRSRKHESGEALPEEADPVTPALLLEQREERDRVWTIARRLKPAQYEALWLRYGEGFSIAETARILSCNSIRLRVLLHRARGQLARLLEQTHELRMQRLLP
jgi:RNA polymerase sigma-70 factor, ECF subfamily